MNYRHYPSTSKWNEELGRKLYDSKCGKSDLSFAEMARATGKITCPDCILAMLTHHENQIVALEERYEELYPGRPVGEKLQ